MDEIKRLLNLVQAQGHDVWIGDPASPEAMAKLEDAMQVALPGSLRLFLTTYGVLGVYDNFLSGIVDDDPLDTDGGGIYSDTLALREYGEVPESFWVIRVHEDGAYCIDTSKPTDDGEFAVVNYEYGSCQHDRILAKSYTDFVCRWFFASWASES